MKQAMESAVRGMSGEHCKQCGTPLPGTARFCPECGAVLRPTGSFAHGAGGGRPGRRSRAPRWLPLPLVGRDERARIGSTGSSARRWCWSGEPGVGKTARRRGVGGARGGRASARWSWPAPIPTGATTPWYRDPAGCWRSCLSLGGAADARGDRSRQADASSRRIARGCTSCSASAARRPKLPLDVRRRECVAAALQSLRRADCDAGVRGRRPLGRAVAPHARPSSSASRAPRRCWRRRRATRCSTSRWRSCACRRSTPHGAGASWGCRRAWPICSGGMPLAIVDGCARVAGVKLDATSLPQALARRGWWWPAATCRRRCWRRRRS